MATVAEIQTQDQQPTGILIEGYADGTVVSFDTRQPEARAAIMASLDRLAGPSRPAPRPVPVTEAHRAAVLARCPGATPWQVQTLAEIDVMFGGRR